MIRFQLCTQCDTPKRRAAEKSTSNLMISQQRRVEERELVKNDAEITIRRYAHQHYWPHNTRHWCLWCQDKLRITATTAGWHKEPIRCRLRSLTNAEFNKHSRNNLKLHHATLARLDPSPGSINEDFLLKSLLSTNVSRSGHQLSFKHVLYTGHTISCRRRDAQDIFLCRIRQGARTTRCRWPTTSKPRLPNARVATRKKILSLGKKSFLTHTASYHDFLNKY